MSRLYAEYLAGNLDKYELFTTENPGVACEPRSIGVVSDVGSSEICVTATSKSGTSMVLQVSALVVDLDERYNADFIVNHLKNAHYFCGSRKNIRFTVDDLTIVSTAFSGSQGLYSVPFNFALTSCYGLVVG